jgi:uncharacterized protein GlcG (DUF336 family)
MLGQQKTAPLCFRSAEIPRIVELDAAIVEEEQMLAMIKGSGAALLVFAIVAWTAAAKAQEKGLVTLHKLSARLANELVGETVAICAQRGYAVVAVVADLDGVRQAMLRGDGAPMHSVDNAFYKAYSAASLTLARKEDSTKAVAERMAKAAATTVPATPLPNVTYAIGGVALIVDGATIGGLGVSGAPGGQLDEDCARAAIAKIQDRMK